MSDQYHKLYPSTIYHFYWDDAEYMVLRGSTSEQEFCMWLYDPHSVHHYTTGMSVTAHGTAPILSWNKLYWFGKRREWSLTNMLLWETLLEAQQLAETQKTRQLLERVGWID